MYLQHVCSHICDTLVCSRIHTCIGLYFKILSLVQTSFAKETYNFIDPTNQHVCSYLHVSL